MRIFITGGSRGIGRAIAEELMPSHEVMISARAENSFRDMNTDRLSSVKRIVADLSDRRQAEALAGRVIELGFQTDVLLLNAGCFYEESLEQSTKDHIEEQVQVNLLSQIQLIRTFAPVLRRSPRPRVIIIGSTSAFESYSFGPVYSITKWALRGLAENARAELRRDRIGVTLIHPGATWTDLWDGSDFPRNRLLEPSDIAKVTSTIIELSEQANVDEIIIRPIEGDFHE